MAESGGAKQNNTKIDGNIFVFHAPRFETIGNAVVKQAQQKSKHSNWEISHFEVDLNSSQPSSKKRKIPSMTQSSGGTSTENTEALSQLNLNYEFEGLHNSVIAYLEDTFSENRRQLSQGFNTKTEDRSIDGKITADTNRSAQLEYSSSLEQSQKIFDKMQGFVELSLIDESASPKAENQTNSTEISTQTEDTQSLSNTSTSHENLSTSKLCFFTKLSNCTKHRSTVNIFAAVLEVNPVKEIKVKSGINCGQYVKLSSVLVGDPTREYFKLTFWRKAAEWVASLTAGDVIVVRKLKVEKWDDEFYAQSTFGTTLVNLQRDSAYRVPAQWLTIVSRAEAKDLLKWLKRKHPYLETQTTPPREDVTWKTLKEFVPNTVVHYRAKIVKVLTYGSKRGKYEFEKRKINKIVAVAIDEESLEEVPICLWGSQAEWQYDLKSKIGQTWNFTFLRVECKTVHGELVLHTTPQSTKFRNDTTTSFFLRPTSLAPPAEASLTFSTISELLKANPNRKAIISAGVTKIMSDNTDHSERTIDNASDFITIQRFFRDLVYLGCKSCLRALKQDHNGIYVHCSYCIQHNSDYRYGVMYCFKPCVVYLTDKSASIVAKSNHEATSRFLKDVKAQDVLEEDASSKLLERLRDIFATASTKAILKCGTVLDENDFIKSQNFELLDLQT